jgi:S-layer protein (TIGR01567 family)
MDSNREIIISNQEPLNLSEGYALHIAAMGVDGNKALISLTKNGINIDKKMIDISHGSSPGSNSDFIYRTDMGSAGKTEIIAVHFKNAFRGEEEDYATVNGIFQISENAIVVNGSRDLNGSHVEEVDLQGMTLTLTDHGERSKVYAERKDYEYSSWGSYSLFKLQEGDYFAVHDQSIAKNSQKNPMEPLASLSMNPNLMAYERVTKVLLDDNSEITMTSGTPFLLEDGYSLLLKSIDVNGNGIMVELQKDGERIDRMILSPSIDGATVFDKTYYYRKDLWMAKDVVVIAVHFKNAFRGSDQSIASIDGVFQISEEPISIGLDQDYGKMTVTEVDPASRDIVLTNKYDRITLTKNKDISIMGRIFIQTADQANATASNPLRYFLYVAESGADEQAQHY